jgi:hypothetical protein
MMKKVTYKACLLSVLFSWCSVSVVHAETKEEVCAVITKDINKLIEFSDCPPLNGELCRCHLVYLGWVYFHLKTYLSKPQTAAIVKDPQFIREVWASCLKGKSIEAVNKVFLSLVGGINPKGDRVHGWCAGMEILLEMYPGKLDVLEAFNRAEKLGEENVALVLVDPLQTIFLRLEEAAGLS